MATRSGPPIRFSLVVLTVVFVISFRLQAQVILPGNPSTATPLAPTTIIQDTAGPQLPAALEQEARAEIAALRGIPNDTLNDYWSRGEIRAWMLLHALRVGYKQPSQYTPEEQQIANYFNVWLYQENAEIALTAFALYNSFSQNPCGFTLPPGIGKDNGRDYLDEDGVTSFCKTPMPPPIFGTFVYVPVPPASQFWSWAQTIVLNKHFHEWGVQLLSSYPGYYTPTSSVVSTVTLADGVTSYGPDSYTAAGALEYVGALREMDEGTAFLVNQFSQIPATPSPAQAALETEALTDVGIDLLDHGVREIISSDISTATTEIPTLSELADLAALGEDVAPELGEVAIEGAEAGVGPILLAGAITALNIEQSLLDSSVPNDLTKMASCALYSDCTNTPKTISNYAQDPNGGRQMMLEAVIRATMPTYYLPRYHDPAYGAPPKLGPVFPSDQTFLVNGNPSKTFSYTDWNGNGFTASAAYGWFARQVQPPAPANLPTGILYAPAIAYLAPSSSSVNGEEWFAWLNGYSFFAERAAVFAGYGYIVSCPGGVIGPNGSGTNTGVCVQIQPVLPLQAGDQISIGAQVNSIGSLSQSNGLTYIVPTKAVPSTSAALNVVLLAHPTNNCLTSSSLDINGSPRQGVNGHDCVQGSISLTGVGTVSVVQPTAEATLDLSSLKEYYGDPSLSVAVVPYWYSTSNGLVSYTLAAGSAGCSVTTDGTVTITGLGTCRITATQAATSVFKAPGPKTSQFTIAAGQPAMGIIAPDILVGNRAVITVAVSGAGGGLATGSVTLIVDGVTAGTQNLSSSGLATFTLTQPSLGSHSLSASFTGNPAGDFVDNSATGTLTVNPNFGTVVAGSTPQTRTVAYQFTSNTILSGVNILTEGAPNLDYTDYGGSTCQPATSYSAGQSCVVNVQFGPTAAGPRPGAVTLFAAGQTTSLFTALLNGIGEAPAITIDPGAERLLALLPSLGVATDGAGNLYVVHPGLVQKMVSGQNPQTITSALASPKAVAVDGAGNVYISDTINNNVTMVPNENGTLNRADATVVIQGIGTPSGLAIDVQGNLYVADSANGKVWQVPPGGGTAIAVLSNLKAPQAVEVDANLNLYVATSDNLVTEYPAGYKSGGTIKPIAMGKGYLNPQGLAVDASGTLYVADTGNAQIVAVAPGGASQSTLTIGGPQFGNYFTGPLAITVDSANNLYIVDLSAGLVKVNRTQPASLAFSAANNTTSAAQLLTVTDAGNQSLDISSYAVPANFGVQASKGTDCTTGSVLQPGVSCEFAVVFTPTTGVSAAGTMTINSNAPGPTSTESVSLQGAILLAQTITFTTSPPASTPDDSRGAFNVGAIASSGLPVTFSSAGVCTNFGTLYLMTGTTGTCSVVVTQPGNATYAPASLTFVTTVLKDTFVYFTSVPPAAVLTNSNFTASATGVSAQPITFTAAGPCTTSGPVTHSGAVYTQTFTMTGSTGTCTLTAKQAAGNGFVASSASITTIPIQGQTVTFTQNAPPTAIYGQTFTVAATSTSGLPVTFSSSGACTNFGATFTITSNSGTCSVIAGQAGDANYFPATPVTETTAAQPMPTVNFGPVAVGTQSLQTLTYTFTAPATLSAVNVLTLGAPGLDYRNSAGSTCKAGVAYNAGASCSINVAFNPTNAGARPGAVTLFAQGSNLPLLTAYVGGVGQAGEIAIDPGAKSKLGTVAGGQADGSAIDASGNVYVVDYWNNQVIKIAAGTKVRSTVVAGLSNPVWVALDGAGNLYISQVGPEGNNGSVVMVPNENGTLNSADMSTLNFSSPVTSPHALAVDASGNLYVTDYFNGTINIFPSGGGIGSTLIKGLNTPFGLAVDSYGNLFVSSYEGNTVTEYAAPILYSPIPVGSGYSGPQGVAVDPAGDVYVADSGNGRVEEILTAEPYSNVVYPGTQSTVASGLKSPVAVTVSSGGNLLISDGAFVYAVNRTQPAPLVFPATSIFGTSAPETLVLTNVGNNEVDFIGGAFSPDFQAPDNCYLLYPGNQCSATVTFWPGNTSGVLGPRKGTISWTDTAITGKGTQMVVATGTAVYPTTITFTTPPPASALTGTTFHVEAQATSHYTMSFKSSGVCRNTPATLIDPANAIYASTYTMTSGAGSCSVIASVPQTSGYSAAASATEVVIAGKNAQTIIFAQPPNEPLGKKTYILSATATSRLPVIFTSLTASVCTVSSNTVSLRTAGTCSIQASQPGNADYVTAAPVIRSFQITP